MAFVRVAGLLAAAACVLVNGNNGAAAQRDIQVDLELVLAVDVSLSMDIGEQRLQRDGYVAALRDPQIHKAIRSGPNGRIALAYLEWAGAGIQSVVVPWQLIASPGDAEAFARALADKPISRNLMTSISAAIEVSAGLFDGNGYSGLRRVIDVSGDGPNNSGAPVEAKRDAASEAGITINGLAIQVAPGRGQYSYFDLPDLDRYYKDCVIAGPGSFVLTIKRREAFKTAIRQKLLLEIAGAAGPGRGGVRQIQFTPDTAKYDCLIGERMWQQYRNDEW